jgi:hypothetical protein
MAHQGALRWAPKRARRSVKPGALLEPGHQAQVAQRALSVLPPCALLVLGNPSTALTVPISGPFPHPLLPGRGLGQKVAAVVGAATALHLDGALACRGQARATHAEQCFELVLKVHARCAVDMGELLCYKARFRNSILLSSCATLSSPLRSGTLLRQVLLLIQRGRSRCRSALCLGALKQRALLPSRTAQHGLALFHAAFLRSVKGIASWAWCCGSGQSAACASSWRAATWGGRSSRRRRGRPPPCAREPQRLTGTARARTRAAAAAHLLAPGALARRVPAAAGRAPAVALHTSQPARDSGPPVRSRVSGSAELPLMGLLGRHLKASLMLGRACVGAACMLSRGRAGAQAQSCRAGGHRGRQLCFYLEQPYAAWLHLALKQPGMCCCGNET